ncbi:histidine kinase N-terminal 7TM domain-containing protein [Natronoarchaeum mannanilyticum]|uniref:histidine kinase n=1 Tax=Natronoarchaeum mannanilyticum TaxID=926360 RepID=A0AAV3TBE3_9EURY
MIGPPLYTSLLGIGVALCLAIAALAWRHRPSPGATPLVGLSLGAGIWAFATLAQVLVEGYDASVFWGKLAYLGIVVGGTFWFVLTLEYSGRERYLKLPTVGLLAIEPVAINALVWTNGAHHLVWASVEPVASLYGYEVTYGPAFWAHASYSYALLAAGSLLVLGQLYRSRSIYRGQAFAMFLSALAPWVGNALFLSQSTAADWAPIGFVVSCVALFWAMRTRDLVDVTPVARNTVLDRIPSGVAVVDRNDRVLDANAELERLVGAEYDRLVGATVDEAFADHPPLASAIGDGNGTSQITFAADGEPRHFDVEIEPLIDDLDRRIGRIALVHDVTEQRRRERELERKNEQLDRFAEVLAHDLRNPLNVADGYLDVVAETGDLEHVGRIRSAHERMNDLIEDVRTLVTQGQTVTETERLDLAAVARAAASNVDTRDAAVRVDDDLGVVEADENRLLQAFENLFRNAVEHGVESPATRDAPAAAPADGAGGADESASDGGVGGRDADDVDEPAVTITVGRLDDAAAGRNGFYVADDGPGIPPDAREKIFESGYTTGDDGTGLGLAIVQNAIEAHGWRIEAAESESGGASFEVTGVAFTAE